MKYSFSTMAMPGMALEDVVKVAKEYGFDGVDLRVRDKDGDINENITSEELAKIKELFSDGLEISSLLCYNRMLGAERKDDDEEGIAASILNCIRIAETLNVKIIRIFSGRLTNEDDVLFMAKILNRVFEKHTSDVLVLIQNHRNCGVTCAHGELMKQHVKDKRFGIILSPDHEALAGNDIYAECAKVLDITKQFYIADVNTDNKLCLIGEGVVDFNKVLKMLTDTGYDGYITLKWEKCWHPELADYDVAFKSFKDYFKL